MVLLQNAMQQYAIAIAAKSLMMIITAKVVVLPPALSGAPKNSIAANTTALQAIHVT